MRTKVTQIDLYTFDELGTDAQRTALEACWDINVDDSFWFESVTDDIAEFGKVSGLGCTYGGSFDCERGAFVHITDCSTTLSEVLSKREDCKDFPHVSADVMEPFFAACTAKEWTQLTRLERAGYLGTLAGETHSERRGRRADVERFDYGSRSPRLSALLDKLEEAWGDLLRLETCYLTMLREEYAYQTSEDAIRESILVNALEFDINGHRA